MNSRLSKELASLKSPPEGIVVFPTSPTTITAKFKPLLDSPYSLESAFFELSITIPARYPFEPPNIRFVTAIYHPNVDSQGRICHDLLKMPPIGGWSPAHNVLSLIKAIQWLVYEPNPDDPLDVDIASIFKKDYHLFAENARLFTLKHAIVEESNQDKLLPVVSKSGNTEDLGKLHNNELPLKINIPSDQIGTQIPEINVVTVTAIDLCPVVDDCDTENKNCDQNEKKRSGVAARESESKMIKLTDEITANTSPTAGLKLNQTGKEFHIGDFTNAKENCTDCSRGKQKDSAKEPVVKRSLKSLFMRGKN